MKTQSWFCLTIIGSAFILSTTLAFGFGYDQGVLGYLGWAILHGRWPYIDVWDTAFPGGMLIYALVIAMCGKSALSFRAFDFIVQILTAILIFGLARRIAGPRAGTISALFYATTYASTGYYHTAQRDGFIVPFLLLGVWSLWKWCLEPEPGWMAVAGISFGLMCIIRPTYALLVAIVACYVLLFPNGRQRSRSLCVRDVLLLAVLCSLPMALLVGVYVCHGALSTLIDLVSYLAVVHPKIERAGHFQLLHVLIRYAPQIVWAGVGMSVLSPTRWRYRWHYGFLIAALGACTLIRLWESKAYLYLFLPVYACASVMAGIGWSFGITAIVWLARLPRQWRQIAVASITGIVILWPIFYAGLVDDIWRVVPNLRRSLTEGPSYRSLVADSADQAEIARYLYENTDPTDTVQIWGAEPGILYAAERFAASRFVQAHVFSCGEGNILRVQGSWREEFFDSITTRHPRYIVAHYANGSLAVQEFASFAPDCPELRNIIDQNYELEATFGIWSVFRRKEGHD